MTDNFPAFARLVAASFQDIAKRAGVYVTSADGDELFALYLRAFPEGTNERFKERTEHDCSCCKQFIRRAGNVVAVNDAGRVLTVWDKAAESAPFPYNVVANALRSTVLASPISDLFRVSDKECSFGNMTTRSFEKETEKALTWNHLYTGEIPRQLRSKSPDEVRGNYRTTVQVFERGLTELAPGAVETVLALVEANNLYRGEEHKAAVVEFQRAQAAYLAKPAGRERSVYAWTNAFGPASRFRNTVIGTLVQDISEGKDVERAVESFETKVAPTNYKRTTAVITPGMVKNAMKTIEELGLEPALERRFATIADISVNDVKWVDGGAKPLMKGGIGDVLMQHATAANPKSTEEEVARAEPVTIDEFVSKVLPDATSVEVLLKGSHVGNLVSLTAPVHPEPKQLFKWSNDFAWSYRGNVTDSIKERVKKAGGRVEGVLRVSLSWFNHDDLDLHIHEPAGRGAHAYKSAYGYMTHIHFRNKVGWTGGTLDVDMNAGHGHTREPVENVIWARSVPDGAYRIVVNNFCRRESSDVGFVIEVENCGKVSHFSYNKGVRDKADVEVATLTVRDGVVVDIKIGDAGITASNVSQTVWGLATEQYVKVNAVTLSPNYWGESAVGNKHTFFLLDGAKNDEATRGFYNEYLHPRLEQHRKVFEIIGDKTKCQPTEAQLSGLGFSSTKHDSVIVRVRQGKKQRLFNVQVG